MVLRKLSKFFELKNSDFEDESTGSIVLALLFLPLRLLWGFVYFMVFAWTTSRSGRAFIFSIPAMLATIVFVGVVWAIGFKGETKALGLAYLYYTKHSDPNEPIYDPEAAILFARKTVEEDPTNPAFKYELGRAYDLNEDYYNAFNVMNWIAPDTELDSPGATEGFSDAHLWIADYYKDEKKSDFAEEQRETLSRKQIRLAYLANPENVFAVLGLAGIVREDADRLKEEIEDLDADSEIAKGKTALYEEKIDETKKLLNSAIDFGLVTPRQLYASTALVELMQERGEDEEARLTGLRFINKYQHLAEKNPDVLPLWISIVKVCILIGDFERGNRYISNGYQLATNPEIRRALAQLSAQIEVEKSRSFEDMEDKEQFLNRLYALSNAIITDFQVPEGYAEILYYVDGFPFESEQDFWLRDSILGSTASKSSTDPRIPGVVHIILGLREIIEGQKENGKKDWEVAGQQFQLAPFAINFFIQVFSDKRELESEKRNELISTAIEMFPQAPHFYATRGRYLMEDKKYEEAVEDLEFAAARIPEGINITEDLIECYEELDNTEKVETYKAKLDELKSREEKDELSTGFSSEGQ